MASWKFHVDWTTPASSTLTGPTTLATAPFTLACSGGTCIPQAGTTQQLDSLADRLMYRLAYRNFGDHESMVVTHSVTAGSSTGTRWYELRLDGGHNPSIFQQGTYAPDANFRWMGSIAMDQSGNMALGFSLSSSSVHPQIHYTGRLAGDPAGQMAQGEATIINGAGSQTGSSLSRWGDYTSMAVDPTDDCTFWYTNEYLQSNGAFNWSTRIASFTFPNCVAPLSVAINPNSGPAHTAVTLSGAGFGAGEQVAVKYITGLSSPKPASVTLCTATATAIGTFSCNGTIPSASTAGAHAVHKIVAKGHTSLRKAKTTFTLT
jgi:hypothetical protein